MFSTTTLHNRDDDARRFQHAEPFRHVVVDNFLDPDVCVQLRRDFPGFEERHALNEMGEVGGKAVRMDVREISAAYKALDAWLQSPEFLGYVSRLTGIPDLLYDPDYVGGGTHENREGQSLDTHIDFNYHPRTQWHRRLNLIIYLNPEWDAAWGGCLELHSDPWRDHRDEPVVVPPLFNKCVVFETTEHSWHGFSEIHIPAGQGVQSRQSFAIYLYSKERPRDELATAHATVYVPEGMPDWKAGRSLSTSDLEDLAKRFARLRGQLRYRYQREQDYEQQIDALNHALREARAAQRVPLQGYAEQHGAPVGLWPDAWAAREWTFRFTPQRKVRAVSLQLQVPKQLQADQELQLSLGGKRWVQVLTPGSKVNVDLPVRLSAGKQAELVVQANQTWSPAKAGESGDDRDLAYRVLSLHLKH